MAAWISKLFTDLWQRISTLPTVALCIIGYFLLVVLVVMLVLCRVFLRRFSVSKEVDASEIGRRYRWTSLSTIDEKSEPATSPESQSGLDFQ